MIRSRWTISLLIFALLGCWLTLRSGAQQGLIAPAAAAPAAATPAEVAQAAPQTGTRGDLVSALRSALKSEQDPETRLLTAECLLRLEPGENSAAEELVKALTSDSSTLPADAYQAMERLLPGTPPALVRALTPVVRSGKEIDRRRAISLLRKINPHAVLD